MGPRPFSRGNGKVGHLAGVFAKTSLQWGRGLSAAEITRSHAATNERQRRFNGAAAFQPRKFWLYWRTESPTQGLQWGRGLSAAEMKGDSARAFNDLAASMGPRPFSRGNISGRSRPPSNRLASMGPRPFSRGNVEVLGYGDVAMVASMGPRPFSRGNRVSPLARRVRARGLQWGRGLSAAEIRAEGNANQQRRDASMGPRPFSRGNDQARGRAGRG